MQLLALELTQFRNIAFSLVEPHPRFSVFWGENGQGKTNLLEAVYLLGTLRSFRANRTEELVRFGAPAAQLRARTARGGRGAVVERRVEIGIHAGGKTARVDGKSVRATDFQSGVNVVLFAPEDLQLPRGAPSGRRRFLDRAVWNLHPGYLREAQAYEKTLRSRNALLRAETFDAALLKVYDEQLAKAAVPIVERRRQLVVALAPRVDEVLQRVLGETHRVEARYRTALGANVEADLLSALDRDRRKDQARGATSSGPHTDDLELFLDGKPASAFASQGQSRALVLALKIAEIAEIERQLGDAPLLLLDDVSSELDEKRNAQLFAYLRETRGQTFISTTHPRHVLIEQDRKDFQVVGGAITG